MLLDIKAQLLEYTEQLKACFYEDKNLVWRIVINIFTGLSALWCYLVVALCLFFVSMMQVPGEGINTFMKDETINAGVRITVLIISFPVLFLCFVTIPFFLICMWVMQFMFNCFAYVASLGKSGWSTYKFK